MAFDIERQVQQLTDRLGGDIVEVELQPGFVSAVLDGVCPEWPNFFESAIRWLPAACLIAAQRLGDYRQVAKEVVSFLKFDQGELRRVSLWSDVRDLPSGILYAWTETMEAGEARNYFPQREPYSYSLSLSDVDELLGALYETRIEEDGTTLFSRTFIGWCSETSNAARMLHILGFFYRVRCQPSDLPLYRADSVLAAAFDKGNCDRLWQDSREFAKQVLPHDAYTALESLFSRNG